MKTFAIVIGCLLALGIFLTAADFIGRELGLRHLGEVTAYLLGIASTAGFFGGIYLCRKYSWSRPLERTRFAGCVALSVLSLFVSMAMRDPDSPCYVDWDGRSNSTVCD